MENARFCELLTLLTLFFIIVKKCTLSRVTIKIEQNFEPRINFIALYCYIFSVSVWWGCDSLCCGCGFITVLGRKVKKLKDCFFASISRKRSSNPSLNPFFNKLLLPSKSFKICFVSTQYKFGIKMLS